LHFTHCEVIELSVKGATLKSADALALPDHFLTSIAGGLPQKCKVVWRKDDLLGVKFCDQPSAGVLWAEQANLSEPCPSRRD
jgi:hypothetical protein